MEEVEESTPEKLSWVWWCFWKADKGWGKSSRDQGQWWPWGMFHKVILDVTFPGSELIDGLNHMNCSNCWSFSFGVCRVTLVRSFFFFGQRRDLKHKHHGLFWLVPLQQWHNIVFVLTSTQPVTSCFSGPPRVWIARLSRSPGRSSIFFPLRIWKKKPIIIIITLILEIQLQIPYWLCDVITELSNPCGLLTGFSLILWLWWRNHLTSPPEAETDDWTSCFTTALSRS